MGKVVETSFHHLNGKHGRTGHGGQTISRKFPCHGFSCKAHTDLILRLTKECKCSLTEEDVDAKLECSGQNHTSEGASCSEYKYSVLIFC
jgi:hypothetical protein